MVLEFLPMRKYSSYQRLDPTGEGALPIRSRSNSVARLLSKHRLLALVSICALGIITWGILAFHPLRPTDDPRTHDLTDENYQLPPSFDIRRKPMGAKTPPVKEDELSAVIQETWDRKGKPDIECKLLPWHEARYAALKDSPVPHPSASKLQANASTIFIAMNLYNSAGLFGVLIDELPKAIRYLGVQNVHVSIYENGSDDDNGAVLVLREQFWSPRAPRSRKLIIFSATIGWGQWPEPLTQLVARTPLSPRERQRPSTRASPIASMSSPCYETGLLPLSSMLASSVGCLEVNSTRFYS